MSKNRNRSTRIPFDSKSNRIALRTARRDKESFRLSFLTVERDESSVPLSRKLRRYGASLAIAMLVAFSASPSAYAWSHGTGASVHHTRHTGASHGSARASFRSMVTGK